MLTKVQTYTEGKLEAKVNGVGLCKKGKLGMRGKGRNIGWFVDGEKEGGCGGVGKHGYLYESKLT